MKETMMRFLKEKTSLVNSHESIQGAGQATMQDSIQASMQDSKHDSLQYRYMRLGCIFISFVFLAACDPKSNTLRAKGGQNQTELAKIEAAKITTAPEDLLTEKVNSLAMTGALDFAETPKALIGVLQYLKAEPKTRNELFQKARLIRDTKDMPLKAEFTQSQTLNRNSIQVQQLFEVKAELDGDKINFNDLQISWTENTTIQNELKLIQLSLTREFEFVLHQESPNIFTVTAKDSKISIGFNSEIQEYQMLADLSFRLELGDLSTVTQLKLERSLFSNNKKVLKAPALLLSEQQSFKFANQANQPLVKPLKEMNSHCLTFDAGAFSIGEEGQLIEATVAKNKMTLKTVVTELQACQVPSPMDLQKWLSFVKKPTPPPTAKKADTPLPRGKIGK